MSARRYTIIVIFTIGLAFLAISGGCRRDRGPGPLQIGLVTNNRNGLQNIQGFKEGLSDLGYVEGDQVEYLGGSTPVQGEELRRVLADLVDEKVDLIFTAGTPTGVAAFQVTAGTGIPVVFGVIADPVRAGVLADLNHPGGNMTGVKLNSNQDRRLTLLLELVPDARRIYVPYNPNDPAPSSSVLDIERMADTLNIEIIKGFATSGGEVTELLNNFPADIDAIFMLPDSTVNARIQDLAAIALERKLPVSGPSMVQVADGALMAYGIIHTEAGRQAAQIADQVLRGAVPGDLPVQTAESYLGINLIVAEAIGIEISVDFLQQAEIVIRPLD
jgi:putative ABC transport system substrate-binding protein